MSSKCCIKQIIKAQSLSLRSSQSEGQTHTRTDNSTEGGQYQDRGWHRMPGHAARTRSTTSRGGGKGRFPEEEKDSAPAFFVVILEGRVNLIKASLPF